MGRRIVWKRTGLVITPDQRLWWNRTHAMVPVPECIEHGIYRVYFSGRDAHNRSHIGFAVLDLDRPGKILDFSPEPVLAPGELGCFDDNGVTPSSIVSAGARKLLYYIGWNPGATVRVHLFGGLATSDDGGKTFTRYSRAPILERIQVDPYLNTAPYVMLDEGRWRMYYVSGVGWLHKDLPCYNIKHATSDDGYKWRRDGHVCIDFATESEHALARPWVVRDEDCYRMWFSHRGGTYQIGYAESDDGLHWERDDARGGLSTAAEGWDSEMVEYAAVVVRNGQRFMFYNGNNYGHDGIGLAVEQ